MDYKCITIELPVLSDEAAASVQVFSYRIMNAITEHYYQQIKRYCVYESENPSKDNPSQENLDDLLF